jgi:hypothetical protein
VIGGDWLEVPIGDHAERWVTRCGLRTVLIVVHSMTAMQRLLDISLLFERDVRIQTIYTRAPGVFATTEIDDLLRTLGALMTPWEQAVRMRFDVVLASGYTDLHRLNAPIVVVPHGVSYNKFVPGILDDSESDGVVDRPIYGLNARQLMKHDRVVPSVIGLGHVDDLQVLKESCPQASSKGVVLGDPCFDRICGSMGLREGYRDRIGLRSSQKLLVLTSSWGSESLLGSAMDIVDRTIAAAWSHGHIVALMLHPSVWSGHGTRQIKSWFHRYRGGGLLLLEPDQDWRALLISADWVVGDHGSMVLYALAAGRSVMLIDSPLDLVVGGSAVELVREIVPTIRLNNRMVEQLEGSADVVDDYWRTRIVDRITSEPGGSARLMRETIYRYLELEEPPEPAEWDPVPQPFMRLGA